MMHTWSTCVQSRQNWGRKWEKKHPGPPVELIPAGGNRQRFSQRCHILVEPFLLCQNLIPAVTNVDGSAHCPTCVPSSCRSLPNPQHFAGSDRAGLHRQGCLGSKHLPVLLQERGICQGCSRTCTISLTAVSTKPSTRSDPAVISELGSGRIKGMRQSSQRTFQHM